VVETPILGVLQWDSCVLGGERVEFHFVEKCCMTLFDPVVAARFRKYLPVPFAPYMPPYGAGRDSVSFPSLDPYQGRDRYPSRERKAPLGRETKLVQISV
jgi:hypothetical protein